MNRALHDLIRKKTTAFRILRTIMYLLVAILLALILTTGYLTIRKDYYAAKLLQTVNERFSGTIRFDHLRFTPFAYFPEISVALSNVVFLGDSLQSSSDNEQPIGHVKEMYGTFNLFRLLKGDIFISRIGLKEGQFIVTRFPDSTYNVLRAIMPIHGAGEIKTSTGSPENTFQTDGHGRDPVPFQIDIRNIHLREMGLHYSDLIQNSESHFMIDELKAGLAIEPGTILVNLRSGIRILEYQVTKQWSMDDNDLFLSTRIQVDRQDSTIHIRKGAMTLDHATIDITGSVAYHPEVRFDLNFDGSDADMYFLGIFLTRRGIRNLKAGDIYFRGTLKGELGPGIPNLECRFGINDLRMKIPESGMYIENTRLQGQFISGQKRDLSEAMLKIDTLRSKLPEGYLNGSMRLRNFILPVLNYSLDFRTNLEGFDEVFKLSGIKNLVGSIHLKHQFSGRFSEDSVWIRRDFSTGSIDIDSLSFHVPGYFSLDHLSGRFSGYLDTLLIHDLDVSSSNSDIHVHGTLYNLSQLVKNLGHPILADVHIHSTQFDLAKSLPFIPHIEQSFPYRFRDITMDVSASSTISDLTEFQIVPSIHFNIHHLEGRMDSLIKNLTVDHGIFHLGATDSILNLTFNEFHILSNSGWADASLYIQVPPTGDLEMEVEAALTQLQPSSILFSRNNDSLPGLLYGHLDGQLNGYMHFKKDSVSVFRESSFFMDRLTYVGMNDSIGVDDFLFHLKKGPDKIPDGANPLAILDATIDLEAREVHSHHFTVEDVAYRINVDSGVYNIQPLKSGFFNKPGERRVVIAPFAEPLWCEIDYQVDSFRIEDLLSAFREKPNLSGPMDLHVNLEFSGATWDEILPSMIADVRVTGSGLELNGIDIDKFINNYNRSQKFNLLDAGAVIFTGPVGLAVTKGTDFARLIKIDLNESSPITKIISEWHMENGVLHLEDVAFSTEQNRIAASGYMNLLTDSLDLTVGVVNPQGCDFLSQQIFGSMKEPKMGDLKVISKLFGAVTNLFKDETDCEPFYTGKLPHPGTADQ